MFNERKNRKSPIDQTSSILSAQYNNVYTSPHDLAKIRGSGQFQSQVPLSNNWKIPGPNENQAQSAKTISQYIKQQNLQERNQNTFNQEYDLSSFTPVSDHQNIQWDQIQSNKNLLGDAYLNYGLKITNSTPTILLQFFFNEENVKHLQQRILSEVKKITNIELQPQSEPALLQIMAKQYKASILGGLPSTSVVHLATAYGNKKCSMTERLLRLNQSVLQEAIKEILSGMKAYQNYYKDISSMPTPLSLPVYPGAKGGRVLQPNVGFTSGNSQAIASFNLRNSVIN